MLAGSQEWRCRYCQGRMDTKSARLADRPSLEHLTPTSAMGAIPSRILPQRAMAATKTKPI